MIFRCRLGLRSSRCHVSVVSGRGTCPRPRESPWERVEQSSPDRGKRVRGGSARFHQPKGKGGAVVTDHGRLSHFVFYVLFVFFPLMCPMFPVYPPHPSFCLGGTSLKLGKPLCTAEEQRLSGKGQTTKVETQRKRGETTHTPRL
ncbi:hypothetical protein FKM82_019797 [Ascaphus truei]